MAETNFSKEDVQELLKAVLPNVMEVAVRAAKAPNPVEEREIREQAERDRRRTQLMMEMGRIQEEADLRKQTNCTHSRHPSNAGKLGGHLCARGHGEYITGGQTHGTGRNITATLICMRCSTTWRFRPTDEELVRIEENDGMSGFAPPPPDRCLSQCCPECSEMFTPGDFAQHDQTTCRQQREKAHRERVARMRQIAGV